LGFRVFNASLTSIEIAFASKISIVIGVVMKTMIAESLHIVIPKYSIPYLRISIAIHPFMMITISMSITAISIAINQQRTNYRVCFP